VRLVSEPEFHWRLLEVLATNDISDVGAVTGPGRSGAMAAVYTSHALGVPFIPYGQSHPAHLGRLLLIDTARKSGATLRKAQRDYAYANPLALVCFEESPRVAFWYEATIRPRKLTFPPSPRMPTRVAVFCNGERP
jgi:hypothetical protein